MKIRIIAALSVFVACGTPASAQDGENPPTLKLDRIPSLPAFAGQTRAPAAPVSSFTVETVVGGLSTPWALAFLPGGEILVSVINLDRSASVHFNRGDRIAQLVIQPVVRARFHEVDRLPGSARGAAGFGSTGGHAAG